MTREQAIQELKALQGVGDTECQHSMADTVLCDLLGTLGYDDVVAQWAEVDKWYA